MILSVQYNMPINDINIMSYLTLEETERDRLQLLDTLDEKVISI